MISVDKTLIENCKEKLLQKKLQLLNQAREKQLEYRNRDAKGGDEIDQTMALMEENNFLLAQKRMRIQLVEIEFALARIEKGEFGICEETLEPIEKERLIAIPWTRLSIEGAEIREALDKRFAR